MGKIKNEEDVLFKSKSKRRHNLTYRLFAASILVSVSFICVYRVIHLPIDDGEIVKYWAWIGLFIAELWFILYWSFLVVVRWNPIYRSTFKHNLSHRYEKDLPRIDVLVCTADHELEPPLMVVNTILSVMSFDYPPEKLSVYLSDDGGSIHMFYAMLEATRFAKIWIPFCKKFGIEPRSPEAFFRTVQQPTITSHDDDDDDYFSETNEWLIVKKSYEQMKMRIESSTKQSKIEEEVCKQHKGFREWDFMTNRRDHQATLQILIDGRDPKSLDDDGQPLPTLVYLSREKRPKCHTNFKAGAMNSLLRVSQQISNAPIILNLDCDMYSNYSGSIRDALCFFMDEHEGHNIAFVQFPQSFENIGNNDLYCSSFRVSIETELPGLDGNGGCCYIGTGCFHRRDTLCGKSFSEESCKVNWNKVEVKDSVVVLEETCKALVSCSYEESTEWGKEMGFIYGSPAEDIVTGISIQRRGWRSVYFSPERKAFLGLGPTTLMQSLIQHKRWSEGHFQIVLSKFCTLVYGYRRMPLKLQLSYFPYNLWAVNALPTLYYVVVPSLCLLRGISLFPEATSLWFLPFAYVLVAYSMYSLCEYVLYGGTFRGWWNEQRMWLFRRTSAYLFGFTDTILKLLGFAQSAFAITSKVADEEASQRYEREIIEFGNDSPMLSIISTIALLNLFCLAGGLRMGVMMTNVFDQFAAQMVLCGIVVCINVPVYGGLFFRQDGGRIPSTVTHRSIALALLACVMVMY